MISRTLLAAGLISVVVAGGASAATPPPAPSVLTQAQSGKTFRVAKGRELTLRLSGRWAWDEPRPSGAGVDLTPVEYFVDPGYSEWKIATLRRGTFTIRSTGTRRGADGTSRRPFVVTLRVV